MTEPGRAGVLSVVATPIGNLGDLSDRARRVLADADVICCEDTRHTGQLLAKIGITARRLVSLHAHNERERIGLVLGALGEGSSVALVSDAGTPLVSDPGARLVEACALAEVPIVAVPGPSALLAALVVSGLRTDRFCFEGFLPRKGEERRARLSAIAGAADAVVCYEAPGRVVATLAELEKVCGADRRVVIARELTKLHEEVWRGVLGEAATAPAAQVARGEYVLIVEGTGADASAKRPTLDLREAAGRLGAAGLSRRDVATAMEVLLGASHREAYQAALATRTGAAGVAGAGGEALPEPR